MAVRDKILDGLAWAGITEQARVAKVSAQLVRELGGHTKTHTKTRIKEAVRNTSPPYGRGKAIAEAVTLEYQRQLPIYRRRLEAQTEWERWLSHQARRETRINNAYAAAFGRPSYAPTKHYPGGYGDWDARRAWDEAEKARDKGDQCIALTHQDGYVVCLVLSENENRQPHIATRLKGGPIVRTYLRQRPKDLVTAMVSLGGPKVRTALAKGKRVKTDWVGRRTFIHHDGCDHEAPKVEEIPWKACIYEEQQTEWGIKIKATKVLIKGTETRRTNGECDPEWDEYGLDYIQE